MLSQDFRIVLRDLGLVVPTVGVMAAFSLPVAAAFEEWYALWPLGLTALVAGSFFPALYLPFRGAGEARLKHGLVTVASAWGIAAALGALPLYFISIRLGEGPYADMASAFFESVSGFTGTGLTMALRPDLLPRTLQWWRSFTEWVGGMGIIVVMLTLIVGPGIPSLYFAEARTEKIHPSVVSTVRTMWWIFLLFTFIGACALWTAGMPPWEAINHAMTGIATGGFSLWPDSIGHYNSLVIELVLLFVMIAGAVSFAVHYQAMQRGIGVFVRDVQTSWLLGGLVLGTILIGGESLLRLPPGAAFRQSSFHFFSAMTCTGFSTTALSEWSTTAKLVLALGMVVGGAAGSTAGGIKVIRLVILVKGVGWWVGRLISTPHQVPKFRLGTTSFTEVEAARQAMGAAAIAFLWGACMGLGTIALLHIVPASLADVIFEVASAQGNVGLSVGITHPEMPTMGKLVLCFNMLFGRLEIIPFVMLFRSLFRGME